MDLDRRITKIATILKLCHEYSNLSTCKRLKVGSCLFNWKLTRPYAFGFNGPAKGLSNFSCTEKEGNCGCIHSEMNTLILAGKLHEDCILFSTASPCEMCCGLILNAEKIKAVIYDVGHRTLGEVKLKFGHEIPLIYYSQLLSNREVLRKTGFSYSDLRGDNAVLNSSYSFKDS